MATQTPNFYPESTRPHDSDEIDLRRYLLILVRWWREILAISILAGAVAGASVWLFNSLQAPMYEASADLVIARLSSTIQLDERISTSMGAPQGDVGGWRASLLQLATSGDVAAAVIDELHDELPVQYRNPSELVAQIEPTVPVPTDTSIPSNIIRITATTEDAELSTKIANSWARHLVDYINDLYGTVPESMVTNVSAERDRAFATYQEVQGTLEGFIGTNPIDELSRQLQEKTGLRGEIMVNSTRMISAVVSSEYNAQLTLFNQLVDAPYGARLNLYDILVNAPIVHAASLIATQSAGNAQGLAQLYALRISAVSQLNQARNMERTLVDGGEAAARSNVTALRMLKLTIFSSFQGGVNLLLPTLSEEIGMTLEEQLTDVRALTTVLEGYIDQLEDDITQAAESPMIGTDIAAVSGIDNALNPQAFVDETMLISNTTNAYAHLLSQSGTFDQLATDGSAQTGSAQISNIHEELLVSLEGEIRTLQSKIAAEEATLRQLTHQRDLAWNTYGAVGNKLQELTLLRSSANSEVRLGNPALVPTSAEYPLSPLLPAVALAAAGFIVAVLLAFLIDSLGGAPFFSRRSSSALNQQS